MKRRWLIFLAASVFLMGLLASAPVAMVYAWLAPKDPSPRQLVGLSGTLREGRVTAVVNNNRTVLSDLHWQLKPLWLLAGRFAAQLDGGGENLLVDGGISVTPAGTLRFTQLRTNGRLAALTSAIGYPFPIDGTAGLNFEKLVLSGGVPLTAQGNGMVQGLAYTLARDPIPLGDFQVDVTTEQDVIVASLASVSGPLELKGEARLQPDGAYESLIRVRPRPDASTMVRNLLNSLGQPDVSGWYQIRKVGQMRPKPPPPPA